MAQKKQRITRWKKGGFLGKGGGKWDFGGYLSTIGNYYYCESLRNKKKAKPLRLIRRGSSSTTTASISAGIIMTKADGVHVALLDDAAADASTVVNIAADILTTTFLPNPLYLAMYQPPVGTVVVRVRATRRAMWRATVALRSIRRARCAGARAPTRHRTRR